MIVHPLSTQVAEKLRKMVHMKDPILWSFRSDDLVTIFAHANKYAIVIKVKRSHLALSQATSYLGTEGDGELRVQELLDGDGYKFGIGRHRFFHG